MPFEAEINDLDDLQFNNALSINSVNTNNTVNAALANNQQIKQISKQ